MYAIILYLKGLTVFMKNIFKCAAAVTMAAALACSAGCTGDTKWSFKTDHLSLTSGMWISYTFDGVNNALQKVIPANTIIPTSTRTIIPRCMKNWVYRRTAIARLT